MNSWRSTCLLASVLALGAESPVAAAELVKSNPPNGANLSAAPARIKLVFNEPVQLPLLVLRPQLAPPVDLIVEPGDKFTRAKTAELPELPPDRYRVQWRAQSGPGQITGGGFVFTVQRRPTVTTPPKEK